MCYIANVGDSRGVISKNGGKVIQALTNDHKPSENSEMKRIIDAGGKVYQ
jgi:serine/threonine protein phosphatase PrpC